LFNQLLQIAAAGIEDLDDLFCSASAARPPVGQQLRPSRMLASGVFSSWERWRRN
jgi:hypothetical protein